MLAINSISFSYQDTNYKSLKSISFSIEEGTSLAVIGESGCGKSTLLKLIYGLYDVDEGTIHWRNKLVTGPKFNLVPGMPSMKFLAQDFDLMPYITVTENVGKYLSNFYPEQKRARVEELLKVVEMEEFYNVKAKYLSGGQMQRVALAKVLAKEPELLLLDEPFSHIDNFRKNSLRRNIFNYLKSKNITCIIATHDVNDSLSFTDEILVMKDGKQVMKGDTFSVYNSKLNKYVASLFDDISEIEINGENRLVYPHEFEIVEKSEIEVEVNNNYFKGNHFLVEGNFRNNLIYFLSDKKLNKKQKVFLSLNSNF
ncbi:MAG: ABC transporter ATP-binding protein [Flavobacteriaceae bacterium]|nr:ABC transporter ATP-binding protein [Flavobacteriaceae bacterium]